MSERLLKLQQVFQVLRERQATSSQRSVTRLCFQRRRWTQLFDTSIGVDLRQAIRDDVGFDPCEEGLRSVCWRAFLLYGPLSKASWTKKLSESRTTYTSLRDHFLKYIDNPNDLHSSADPLADDDTSPWSTLRQDELNREEIFQDVTRCMQENYFFREPTTQKKLLDILFIYSKLNPDTGYRQGMHELLAPVLWVIHQDVIDSTTVSEPAKAKEGADFMLNVLDKRYIEHDAFNLFCAVMQTSKSFYELGDNHDSSVIVTQSNRIHDELLAAINPDLAHHLQVIGILPQIYSIRWIRLLFGREFDFKDVLKIWDMLFAENLTVDIVDMTCVAILLRMHWQLIDSDYTTAITLLTRFKLPPSKESPRSLVKDASHLNRNRTAEAGASVIQHYSGQRPKVAGPDEERPYTPLFNQQRQNNKRLAHAHSRSSPSLSPARFSTSQRQLENLFSEVSGSLQRRTEGWSVSKAVRGAVGEVKRNVNNLSTTHSRETSVDTGNRFSSEEVVSLKSRLATLEKRNQALAKMLEAATNSLRTCKPGSGEDAATVDDTFNIALAKIQFVSVYLADHEIPIPPEDEDRQEGPALAVQQHVVPDQIGDDTSSVVSQAFDDNHKVSVVKPEQQKDAEKDKQPMKKSHAQLRPSLADSSFSFMLGENRHRSSFVSSVDDLPERRRDSDARTQPKQQLWDEGKDRQDRRSGGHDDGFTMSSLQ